MRQKDHRITYSNQPSFFWMELDLHQNFLRFPLYSQTEMIGQFEADISYQTTTGANAMGLILLILLLILMFGGGGFYIGAPYHYYGGGLSTILLIVLIVMLVRR